MARTLTINISLAASLEKYVSAKVASGEYDSPGQVIAQCVKVAKDLEEQEILYWKDVNKKIASARKQVERGECVDGELAMDEIIAEISMPQNNSKWQRRK